MITTNQLISVAQIALGGLFTSVVLLWAQRLVARKERRRELIKTVYGQVTKWVKAAGIDQLLPTYVLTGKIDWNQMLDMRIARGEDSAPIGDAILEAELILRAWFPTLAKGLERVQSNAGALLNIEREMKVEYQANGARISRERGEAYFKAMDDFSLSANALKEGIIDEARRLGH